MTLKEIKSTYTMVGKVNGKWAAYLQIDHQRFQVCEGTTKTMAKWYATMLSYALEKLMEMSKQTVINNYPEWKETYK